MAKKVTPETAPVVAKVSPLMRMGKTYQMEPERLLQVLTATVIKPTRDGRAASTEEVAAFCIVANQYRLNPFRKEIHAFVDKGGGVVPVVGIDGWCRIINENENFDGCDFVEIHEKPCTVCSGSMHVAVGDQVFPCKICEWTNGTDPVSKLLATRCTLHHKQRSHPVVITERLGECRRNTEPWKAMEHRMLRHKSLMQAGRVAFSISGLFDEDEARDIVLSEVPEQQLKRPERLPETSTGPDLFPEAVATATEAQLKRLWTMCSDAGVSDEDLHLHLHHNYALDSSKDIRKEDYEEICEWVKERKPSGSTKRTTPTT